MTKAKLSDVAKMALADYRLQTKGSERFLSDTVRRALAVSAVYSIMLTRYKVEAERSQHTNPNVYVDAVWEVERELGLRE